MQVLMIMVFAVGCFTAPWCRNIPNPYNPLGYQVPAEGSATDYMLIGSEGAVIVTADVCMDLP